MRTIPWHREPKGPGAAWHMFTDAGGERVELLAYDCPPFGAFGRMCGFEVLTRFRPDGPFHKQVGAGEAENLEAAKAAALAMVGRPRVEWARLPRSWAEKDHPATEHMNASGWCRHCGCGNDVLGYKHLRSCRFRALG